MKKAMMLFAALTLSVANAGRSEGRASTDLIFKTTVVPGCAVALASSYTSQTGTYNGTDVNPEALNLGAPGTGFGEGSSTPMLRCQTGTGVNFAVNGATQSFQAGEMNSPQTSNVSFSGRLTLVLNGWQGTWNAGDDNKNLRGNYTVNITKYNMASGNGDTYGMDASFTPDAGWFEAMVGDYTGTLTLNVDY
ncbi:hypothetical protein [Deinococcus radiotolerans]|uniref:Spore coat protein U domain-containing protein n=1 Tax=Deinococcus radiotolerans TaxID=1309407 RepID=A0ABQ2FJ17_9DEIO|nr:hypothetical protein [Deinococcus radiotolerans]GGL03029.1 hypothetical protein GCM10010844_22030 [Deinococcus radiotolerans]